MKNTELKKKKSYDKNVMLMQKSKKILSDLTSK